MMIVQVQVHEEAQLQILNNLDYLLHRFVLVLAWLNLCILKLLVGTKFSGYSL
jgi:hypothetical protein